MQNLMYAYGSETSKQFVVALCLKIYIFDILLGYFTKFRVDINSAVSSAEDEAALTS